MFSFLRKERLGDEQGEISVLYTCLFKHSVELGLHLLPYSIAIGLDYHTTAYGRLLGKVCFYDKIIKPLAVIVSSFSKVFEFFCHFISVLIISDSVGKTILSFRKFPI